MGKTTNPIRPCFFNNIQVSFPQSSPSSELPFCSVGPVPYSISPTHYRRSNYLRVPHTKPRGTSPQQTNPPYLQEPPPTVVLSTTPTTFGYTETNKDSTRYPSTPPEPSSSTALTRDDTLSKHYSRNIPCWTDSS